MLENYSWAEIAAACKNNEVPAAWHVGDTKTMMINGVECDVAIIGKNHDSFADGSGVAPLTFLIVDVGATVRSQWNSTDTTIGGWPASEVRTLLNTSIIDSLEDDVKNNIKAVKKLTYMGAEVAGDYYNRFEESEDRLFLLSSTEFNGGTNEGAQYEYFANGYFTRDNCPSLYNNYWWTRSPFPRYEGYVKLHSTGFSYSGNSPASSSSALMFGFCF